jgi:hypothetical protein
MNATQNKSVTTSKAASFYYDVIHGFLCSKLLCSKRAAYRKPQTIKINNLFNNLEKFAQKCVISDPVQHNESGGLAPNTKTAL